MLALIRKPIMMPEPIFSSEMPNPSPTTPEKRFTTSGIVSTIHLSCVARNVTPDAASALTMANADLRASSPCESSMIDYYVEAGLPRDNMPNVPDILNLELAL